MAGHLAAAVPGRLEELLVDQPHQLQRTLTLPRTTMGRPADADELALSADRQHGVSRIDLSRLRSTRHSSGGFAQEIPLHHKLADPGMEPVDLALLVGRDSFALPEIARNPGYPRSMLKPDHYRIGRSRPDRRLPWAPGQGQPISLQKT